ncbi:MAG: outer membrane lipoprotein carrier protein LolA [Halobacteriovoraceae bacterium]|jgi:outer membrane lipoprotein-sorting protein|nr:outer membrane lipoprotein carrier protein LolA [Halobacteriovoraceae bacterium]MBT5092989.1 outer membrane lipoprotein carrier protein LolA [Halobacteriovoraceae bacterium]
MIKYLLIFLLLSTGAQAKVKNNFLPNSFKATFVQSFKSSLSGKIKKSRGNIAYRYPGNIRFETLKPSHIVFVSNREKTWYYTAPFLEGEAGELSVQKAGKNSLTRFFDVLKKGLKSNPLYKVKMIKGETFLEFTKKTAREVGLRKAGLKFTGKAKAFKNLKSIDLYYLKKKKKVTLTLNSILENQKFKNEDFKFTAPKNTKISY